MTRRGRAASSKPGRRHVAGPGAGALSGLAGVSRADARPAAALQCRGAPAGPTSRPRPRAAPDTLASRARGPGRRTGGHTAEAGRWRPVGSAPGLRLGTCRASSVASRFPSAPLCRRGRVPGFPRRDLRTRKGPPPRARVSGHPRPAGGHLGSHPRGRSNPLFYSVAAAWPRRARWPPPTTPPDGRKPLQSQAETRLRPRWPPATPPPARKNVDAGNGAHR